MLVGTQTGEWCDVLVDAFPTLAKLDQMLLTRVNQRRERISLGIDSGLPGVVAKVVSTAEAEGWTYNLLKGAQSANGTNGELQAFFARYPALDPSAGPPSAVDHFRTMFLVGRRVFLRRDDFREHLRALGQGTNSRVLVVTGPRLTGKTYSRDFIGYLLQYEPSLQGKQRVAFVDLDEFGSGLGDVVLRIGRKLNLDPATMPAQAGEQDSRWSGELFDWLVTAFAQDEVCWLILDGFRVQTLPQAVLDLIDRLGDYADTMTSRLRLILLNYPRPEALPFGLRENIEPDPIRASHLSDFVQAVYRQSGKPFDQASVDAAVNSIVTQVDQQIAKHPENQDSRLTYLSRALTVAANNILAS